MGIVIYRDSAQDDRAWCVCQGLLRCSFGAQSKQHGAGFHPAPTVRPVGISDEFAEIAKTINPDRALFLDGIYR